MVFQFVIIRVLVLDALVFLLSFGMIFNMMKKQTIQSPPMMRKGVCQENRSIMIPARGMPIKVEPAQESSVIPMIFPLFSKGMKFAITA